MAQTVQHFNNLRKLSHDLVYARHYFHTRFEEATSVASQSRQTKLTSVVLQVVLRSEVRRGATQLHKVIGWILCVLLHFQRERPS